ncbi:hypothetical protein BDP27DRAFT_1431553 [Rhodocollybia butyracea]|uniref:Uncharacterized protein n=1 Tax=Rhodocollybia butyracea TaxID=206335 RepID=A0A9P5P6S6_9AGAR|nr:hypothetical protein BDP27DRAFT_1431553 [Rhodocollybia butyracea]
MTVAATSDFDPDHFPETSQSHRGRIRECKQKSKILSDLQTADSSRQFWKGVRDLSDAKVRPPSVTADQLSNVFVKRLNLLPQMPTHFDAGIWKHNSHLSSLIPPNTSTKGLKTNRKVASSRRKLQLLT